MKLTFEEAVDQHRKMWNWIADSIESFQVNGIEIKEAYMQEYFPNNSIVCNCSCCEYDRIFGKGTCRYCPIAWEQNGYCGLEYCDFKEATLCENYAQAAKIARKIANLPAREKMEWE